MLPINADYPVVRLALRYTVASMVTTICATLATSIPSNRFFGVLALVGLTYMAFTALSLAPRRQDMLREFYLLLVIFSLGLSPFLGWVRALDLFWAGSFLIGAFVGVLLMTTKPPSRSPEEWN